MNGAKSGVDACTTTRRTTLRLQFASKRHLSSRLESPASPHGTVRRRAAPPIERRTAVGVFEANFWRECLSVQLSTVTRRHSLSLMTSQLPNRISICSCSNNNLNFNVLQVKINEVFL